MTLPEAKSYIGKRCLIRWKNHREQVETIDTVVQDVLYLPLYGGYLLIKEGDICFDRIEQIRVLGQSGCWREPMPHSARLTSTR